MIKDPLDNYIVYRKALKIHKNVMNDSKLLIGDIRGREIAKQIVRSAGSISATIEEGYGRGYSKEFIRYLKISRGSTRETKGWYLRGEEFFNENILNERIRDLTEIIVILTSMINKMELETNQK